MQSATPTPLPVTSGTRPGATLTVRSATVTEAVFPPRLELPAHAHEHPCLSVVLAGSYEERIGRHRFDPVPGSVLVKPAGEVHADRLGATGSRQLLVEFGAGAAHLDGCAWLCGEVRFLPSPTVLPLAARITRELRHPDSVTPLAVEALLLEILTLLGRTRLGPPPSVSMRRARDYLHDNFAHTIRVADLARVAGLSPDHTARAFRSTFGQTVGTYLRDLRVAWAAAELVASRAPIASIALRAGFADQSHLTRHFRRRLGVTPAVYRRSRRPQGN